MFALEAVWQCPAAVMAGQRGFDGGAGVFNTKSYGQAFEPSPEFNAEDEAHPMMSKAYCHRGEFAL